MRLLLLNNNPAVSRLIKLSAEKAGYELDEFEDYGLVPLNSYDVVLVDNEVYDASALNELKETTGCEYCIYICQRGVQKPDAFNVSLEKPFLPTDFLVLLEKVKNVLGSQQHSFDDSPEQLDEEEEESKHFDIDQIDALEPEKERSFTELDDILQSNQEDVLDNHHENFEFDNVKFEDQLLDEAVAMDEMIESGEYTKDHEPSEEKMDTPFEDFNFDTDASDEEEEKSLEKDEESLEMAPCVLDKDDIDEVKQLLDESEESEEDDLSFLEADKVEEAFEDISEEKEASLPRLEEFEEEPLDLHLSDTLPEPFLEDDLLEKEDEEEVDTLAFVPSFEAYEEEAITEDLEDLKEEEQPFAMEMDEKSGIDSLDDLNENLIKKALGEEVADLEEEPLSVIQPTTQEEEIEVIRGEIEKSISRSISGFAQSDILREALKGMRINISISFDENEAK
ncbi:hypothetical protein [Sulfurospirillum deleyianum]|uniref:Uncharacterized protein n=1 Tax=Sulfurospirillum deleyianum (strain ATCC 51133 / DSM 6946 / 5175) TaxID=525898 RepID=D1AZI0_SULD5|nr:hypothetical protein [Sulfurospirillum deleyianum]ACZ11447.1 hypothetical protein Sdel_0410 [Sulfurospirillum deleyianum DSM 6946]